MSGVQSDILGTASVLNCTIDVERLIAVKRCDLDRYCIFNLNELTTEFVGQQSSSNGRLEVETDNRDDVGNSACVIQKLRNGFVFKIGKTQQRGIVAQPGGNLRFG